MASIPFAVAMCLSLVAANPATLQRLYDTPNHIAVDHFHDHNSGLHDQNFNHARGEGLKAGGSSSSSSALESGSSSSSSGIGSGAGFSSGSGSGAQNDFGVGASAAGGVSVFDAVSGQIKPLSAEIASAGQFFTTGSIKSIDKVSPLELETRPKLGSFGDPTVTKEITVDVFKTLTNVLYNTVPVTLTEFLKTTKVVPTLKVETTPVDDLVFVATVPVLRTDTRTVTDSNTIYQFDTEVSTDTYTVTHRNYDIQQQVVTSTLVQKRVFKPTVVSTRISTEFEITTVVQTVLNTVIETPRRPDNFRFQQSRFGDHVHGFHHSGQRQDSFLQPVFDAGNEDLRHQRQSLHGQFSNTLEPVAQFPGLESSSQVLINLPGNHHRRHSGYYY